MSTLFSGLGLPRDGNARSFGHGAKEAQQESNDNSIPNLGLRVAEAPIVRRHGQGTQMLLHSGRACVAAARAAVSLRHDRFLKRHVWQPSMRTRWPSRTSMVHGANGSPAAFQRPGDLEKRKRVERQTHGWSSSALRKSLHTICRFGNTTPDMQRRFRLGNRAPAAGQLQAHPAGPGRWLSRQPLCWLAGWLALRPRAEI
jgi:hypothetical protein